MTRQARLVRWIGLVVTAVGLVIVAACSKGQPTPGVSISPAAPTPSPSATPTSAASVTPTPSPTPAPTVTVVTSRVAYGLAWPNAGTDGLGAVIHRYQVPPVPTLINIDAAGHRTDLGQPPVDRVSFTFTTAFPSYALQWVAPGDFRATASGQPIALAGNDVLKITFGQFQLGSSVGGGPAQAHNAAGPTAPLNGSVASRTLGRIIAYTRAGDYDGVVVYGLGAHRAIAQSNPQTRVRVSEVHKIVNGQHQYVVAFDIDAS